MSGRIGVLAAAGVLVAASAAACSGGGGGGGGGGALAAPSTDAVCALAARLATAGDALGAVDVGDPEAFDAALDAAVLDYTTTLDSLAEVVPGPLRDDVGEVRGLVEQYRFDEALEARAPLDRYVEQECPARTTSTVATTTTG